MSPLSRVFSIIQDRVNVLMRQEHQLYAIFVAMMEEPEGFYFHLLNEDHTPFSNFYLFVRYEPDDKEFEIQMLEITNGAPCTSLEELQFLKFPYIHNEYDYCPVNKIEKCLSDFFAHVVKVY